MLPRLLCEQLCSLNPNEVMGGLFRVFSAVERVCGVVHGYIIRLFQSSRCTTGPLGNLQVPLYCRDIANLECRLCTPYSMLLPSQELPGWLDFYCVCGWVGGCVCMYVCVCVCMCSYVLICAEDSEYSELRDLLSALPWQLHNSL